MTYEVNSNTSEIANLKNSKDYGQMSNKLTGYAALLNADSPSSIISSENGTNVSDSALQEYITVMLARIEVLSYPLISYHPVIYLNFVCVVDHRP